LKSKSRFINLVLKKKIKLLSDSLKILMLDSPVLNIAGGRADKINNKSTDLKTKVVLETSERQQQNRSLWSPQK